MPSRKLLIVLPVAACLAFGALQFYRPAIQHPNVPVHASKVPDDVQHILERHCYACHSNEPRLAWFDEVEPVYGLVAKDVKSARSRLNFSELGSLPAPVQRAMLFEAVNQIQLGAMPLSRYLAVHPGAKVTPEELTTVKTWLAPFVDTQIVAGNGSAPASSPEPGMHKSLRTVQPEFNGLPLDVSFEAWKPLSTTDRGDNNTFRLILGNDIAVNAVRSGNITPWPDGAQFAKIAWQQELGVDGLIHPGKFVQVELMLKNARTYKKTDGWGWGRWKGVDLKPYGVDTHFVNECTSCHLPVRGNDYVYTLPITSAKVNRDEIVNNAAAALPLKLPYQPLGWNAITMYVDPKTHTTATLYGNDVATSTVLSGRSAVSFPGGPRYVSGAVLALVTWIQREDPHWFGGRIPDRPQAIEFVQVTAGGAKSYSRYDYAGELQEHAVASEEMQRTNFMLGLAPAWLP